MKKAVIDIFLSTAVGLLAGILYDNFIVNKQYEKRIAGEREQTNKYISYTEILNHWLWLKENGINLERYFIEHDIKKIAVYGMGDVGNNFCSELKNTQVEIKYAIDSRAGGVFSDIIEVVEPQNIPSEEIDAIVVTPVHSFSQISEMLSKYISVRFISLNEVIFYL